MNFAYMPAAPQTPAVPTEERAHSPVDSQSSGWLRGAAERSLLWDLSFLWRWPSGCILIWFLCGNRAWGSLVACNSYTELSSSLALSSSVLLGPAPQDGVVLGAQRAAYLGLGMCWHLSG